MGKAPDDLIERMCLTWRHDFGLVRENGIEAGYCGSGMTEAERESLRRNMRQLWEHNIAPFVQMETDILRLQLKEAEKELGRLRWVHGNPDNR